MSDSAQEKMAHAMQDQQAQWSAFTTKALESSMKLFELNLKMAKQSLERMYRTQRDICLLLNHPNKFLLLTRN